MTDRDLAYERSRAQFGQTKVVTIRHRGTPKLDPKHGRVVEKTKNKRGQVVYDIELKAGICPCSECGHAGLHMWHCEDADADCQLCHSLCT